MSSVLGLPDDILYNVVSNLEHHLTSLCAIAQVCHRFHAASRSLIFRHIPNLPCDRRQLLCRSLSETPNLKKYIHSWLPVGLHFDGTFPNDDLEEALALRNLRHLTIERTKGIPKRKKDISWAEARFGGFFSDGRDETDDFHCRFLDVGEKRWDNLCSVNLTSAGSFYFSSTEIARFMLLPNIKRLKVSGLAQMYAPRLSQEHRGASSGLLELELRGEMPWSCENAVVHQLLSLCGRLERLSLHIPMVTRSYCTIGMVSYAVCKVIEPVSPTNLEAMLEPVRATLQELSLLQNRDEAPYDGSVVDLSSFTELTHLEVSAPCVVGNATSLEGRESLHEILPSSLESLTVNFPSSTGILYNNTEQDEFLTMTASEIPPTRYEWLLQFFTHTATHFSHLKNISMSDSIANTRQGHWTPVPWTLPLDLTQPLQSSNIGLGISISYPNLGSPIHRHSWRGCTGRNYSDIKELCDSPGCLGLNDAKEGKEPWDQVKEIRSLYAMIEQHEAAIKHKPMLTKKTVHSMETTNGGKSPKPGLDDDDDAGGRGSTEGSPDSKH